MLLKLSLLSFVVRKL